MRAPRKQAAGGLRAPPTALETPAEVSRAGKPAFVVAEERPGGDTTSYACAEHTLEEGRHEPALLHLI